MKVAVSSTGDSLDSQVDPRFGRSAYFLIVETEGMSYEAISNDNINLASGAGIQTASLVASQGVAAVLTGNCGPKAAQALAQGGIEVIINQAGSVRGVVENYIKGIGIPKTESSISEKSGFGGITQVENAGMSQPAGGIGSGRGIAGGGRGMGGGGGRGMGGGSGKGRGMGRRRS